ncbi:TPA: DUF4054 domain-containing protein [Clostridium botulinum]|uniref:DUF4054 domain-containing protein n=1 Tax=Clostridium botulinum TaxID=1491 RepID=UPI00035BB022|nr:DUF4054 domain-containing protein [Clostridium botulinum]EPS56766.1 putative bacteriophage protein [Clostridium botulinum Af84]MBN3360182.1 DUF4054 domain-containing protein [Clostridium botulinum]NFM82660.1 DUF4054 domain-containing protein [Clostridium botulinum]NFP12286.1 DUF4054 domain-containing protein [Clostridium botulinum]NFR29746.1 DUF4054 domain-containing protein [Clostridium botulinum]
MSKLNGLIGSAGNIKPGTSPPFTLEDFNQVYPQFKETVPLIVLEMYLDMANACIKESRWHRQWKYGMCLFIAHFCTLYLQGVADANGGVKGILEAGKAQGLDTSISVGDVSISTDYSITTSNIEGWDGWSLSTYGQQLISIGTLLGKGGMYVH